MISFSRSSAYGVPYRLLGTVALFFVGHRRGGIAAGKDDDERLLDLLIGQQVVDDDRSLGPLRPFGAGVTQAVLEIEHGKLAVGGVARRRVDPQHAAQPEGLGVVLDDLYLAVRNVFAHDIESLGRGRILVQVFRLGERGGRGELLSPAPGGRCARLRRLSGALLERGCGGRSGGRRIAGLGMQPTRRHQETRRECDDLRNADQAAHGDRFLF